MLIQQPAMISTLLNRLFLRMEDSQLSWSMRLAVLSTILPDNASRIQSMETMIALMMKLVERIREEKEEAVKISLA